MTTVDAETGIQRGQLWMENGGKRGDNSGWRKRCKEVTIVIGRRRI